MSLYCERCKAPIPGKNGRGRPRRFCSDVCRKQAARRRGREYYVANREGLLRRDLHLMAFDPVMVPFVPRGQIVAFAANRPAWHAWVYGGAERPRR